jgi:acylphosphatase
VSSGQAIRCVVGGRVQGVYYRAAAVERAMALELRGWVKNLPDGRVETVAGGSIEALTEFTSWLWQGPPAAHVDSVHIEEWLGSLPEGFTAQR